MISRIYRDARDLTDRNELVTFLYDIGQEIPDFIEDSSDVFSECCKDIDNEVRELAKARKTITMLPSTDSVEAINEVFWDQSFRVKVELLCWIQRKSMISTETEEVVMRMVADCLGYDDFSFDTRFFRVLRSLTPFPCPCNNTIHRLLDLPSEDWFKDPLKLVFKQPLYRLLEYFWTTNDGRVVHAVAAKLTVASITYKDVRGGKSIVSIIEQSKKTIQEVPTELVEKLIKKAKDCLCDHLGDLLL